MIVTSARMRCKCTVCQEFIESGDRIVRPATTWVHVRCAREAVFEEHPEVRVAGGTGDVSGDSVDSIALRAQINDDVIYREAVERPPVKPHHSVSTSTLRFQDRSLQQELGEDILQHSHKKWTEDADEWLRMQVGRRRHSAYGLGIMARRSTGAIQSRIAKLYGPDSAEVKVYGSFREAGPMTAWTEMDFKFARIDCPWDSTPAAA